ncbi:MAG: UDP-N-acetylmuramate dehydrogenase [Lachnospiraceae bacterium]|nr:UDP-N-acetylmuramate dehydrogenase [Lachnospiraceae bacterium]
MEYKTTEALAEALRKLIPAADIRVAEPMEGHSTFRAGGAADLFIDLESVADLRTCVTLLSREEMPFFLLGRGSNLLVSDKGYPGAVLHLCGAAFKELVIEETKLTAGASVTLHQAAQAAYEAGLSGMEALSGIPGTVGGALTMNAGAYGTEMKDVVQRVTALDLRQLSETEEGIVRLSAEEMCFAYRGSVAKTRPLVFLEAELALTPGQQEDIRARMQELQAKRTEKQPLEFPSAGSTFKRPEGHFAGKLIEDAGLRGYRAGGAQVSEKHCGFIINTGGATATDILTLMRQVRDRVRETSGVTLEPEVMILGEEF